MRGRLEGLDALRGMAAVAVVIYHTVVLCQLLPPSEIGIVGYFYLAVPLFFTISAFAMCAGYSGRLSDWKEIGTFYIRRFLRIAPLFYLMICAWVLMYSYLWRAWHLPAATDFLLNITFLFNFVPNSANSLVPAGWSLGNEMIFYAFFPVLFFILRSFRKALFALLISLTVAVIASILFATFPKQFAWFSVTAQAPFFIAGVLLFHVFAWMRLEAGPRRRWLSFALIGSSVLALVLLSFLPRPWMYWLGWSARPHIIGLLLAPLVLAFALHGFPLFVNRATVFVGKISYGLYLIHPLLIASTASTVKNIVGIQPNWLVVPAVVASILMGAILLATASYYCIELPILRLRARRANLLPYGRETSLNNAGGFGASTG